MNICDMFYQIIYIDRSPARKICPGPRIPHSSLGIVKPFNSCGDDQAYCSQWYTSWPILGQDTPYILANEQKQQHGAEAGTSSIPTDTLSRRKNTASLSVTHQVGFHMLPTYITRKWCVIYRHTMQDLLMVLMTGLDWQLLADFSEVNARPRN